MNRDPALKHNPFASLRQLSATSKTPTSVAQTTLSTTVPLGRVVVREEFDAVENTVITRVIGVPSERLGPIGKHWREVLGYAVLLEGRDLLVMTGDGESIAVLLRDAAASEVVLVRRVRDNLSAAGGAGEASHPCGTVRAQIRRGLRVAVVQKADQESGALTEGVVQDILTSSPEHQRGIKVRLESGQVGRVRRVFSRE